MRLLNTADFSSSIFAFLQSDPEVINATLAMILGSSVQNKYIAFVTPSPLQSNGAG